MDELARRAAQMQPLVQIDEAAPAISAVRRKLAARNGRIQELEAMFVQLCAANGAIHKKGQRYIDQLEQRIKILEARIVDLQEQEIRHANDWRQLESETARVTAENERLRRLPAVRLAHRLARMVSWRRN
jgi:chromosome segregation ATPase